MINTFVSVMQAGSFSQLSAIFYAGLLIVAAGAVAVLVFAPKTAPDAPPPKEEPKPEAAHA